LKSFAPSSLGCNGASTGLPGRSKLRSVCEAWLLV
jgi:hypothetical protein